MMKWVFCPIDDKRVRRENFDCGVPELNEYLQKYARQNHKKGIAKTVVAIPAIPEEGNEDVAGYYSISVGEIKREFLPEMYRRGLPRYPVPAILVGKLAVDVKMQGSGLGKKLLINSFIKSLRISSEVGIFAVKVDAKNESAKAFYLKYGLIPLSNDPLSLFIPIASIAKMLE